YEPLPGEGWVRLLIIEPRLMPGFRCHMRNVELNNALGRYEALSYRWEDSENDRHADMSKLDGITCNGFPMMLKRNLHLALTNLRYRVRPRILWIDAICINQDDAKERSRQVELMGTIYRHSSRTIIWLG
ncbi:HET-domain-containing protein, partial [Pyrenochaeta sp. DS3sAY3a]